MKYSYNWLKWYIPEAPDAEKLAQVLTYHLAEVENLEKLEDGDTIFDIKILPNRAHDLLSHKGLAQELASLLNISYTDPTPKYKIPPSKPTKLEIIIESPNCRRYMARIIRNVPTGPSPEWVVKHLNSIGQRSINNMVDAANLLMFNCGQPAHIFDLDKLSGEEIIARQAKPGEEMLTLDNKHLKLDPSDLIIADSKNVLGLAGVKGGKIPESDNNTKNIVIEVANFDPVALRKSGKKHGIFTDAVKRFENDLPLDLGPYAMRELSALIYEMCPDAVFEDVVDIYPQKIEDRKLAFSQEKISKVLGLAVPDQEIEDILRRYDFPFSSDNGRFEVTVPPMRLDLAMEEDMAEEIGRVLGYDKLKGEIAQVDFKPKQNELYSKIVWTRNKLASEGYSEVMTSSFAMKGKVEVLASASDKNFLRMNLSDGLKESAKLNQANAPLLRTDKVKIFEIGTVWAPKEEMRVAYGDPKEIKEITLDEFCKDMPEDFTPETHTRELASRFKMWPLYPFISRDIAVWVPENIKSEEVLKVIKENAGDMAIRGPELFDEFKKDGKVSYAFRTVFQSYERTLTDAEVNEIMDKISEKIKDKGWQVR